MKITQNAWNDIFDNIGNNPPEVGGILGASNDIVDNIVIDYGNSKNKLCSYSPNVDLLNLIIEKWQENFIEFKGIFHSHYFGVCNLSQGDKKYIETIMKAMPNYIRSLYFPIAVMPDRKLIIFKAYRYDNESIEIEQENVEIVEGGILNDAK